MPPNGLRSKTGCQSCRRRKVRCDEQKPVCSACIRLQLPCFFQPGTGPPVATPRFRVRFVNSPYSLPSPGPSTGAETPRSLSSREDADSKEESSYATAGGSSRSVKVDGDSASITVNIGSSRRWSIQGNAGNTGNTGNTGMGSTGPGSIAGMITPSMEARRPLPNSPSRSYQAQRASTSAAAAAAAAAASPSTSASSHQTTNASLETAVPQVPSFFDLNMHFDQLDEAWLALDTSSVAISSPDDISTGPPDHEHVPVQTPVQTPAQTPMLAQPVSEASPDRSPGGSLPSRPSAASSSAVLIAADDHILIQHYLNVMSQFTKIRASGNENIYMHIFNHMALFYMPLYNAIMAWTGLHLGQTQPQLQPHISQAERRYEQAALQLHADQDVASHFELSLITTWFCLQFELLAARGISSFCQHLEFVADLVDAHRHYHRSGTSMVPLSPIGARVLVWLGTYDARAAWIGGAGRLLHNLEVFAYEYDFLGAAFSGLDGDGERSGHSRRNSPEASPSPRTPQGDQHASGYLSAPPSVQTCLRLSLQFDTVDNRIALLHQRQTPAPSAVWMALQSDLVLSLLQLEGRPTVAPLLGFFFGSPDFSSAGLETEMESKSSREPAMPSMPSMLSRPRPRPPTRITTHEFNDLLLLAACYASIINFHRVLPDHILRTTSPSVQQQLLPAQEAATRILRISSWVCRLRPLSPQNVWPRILFTAGIETADPVYQDWVVNTLTDAERWGGNMAKTRILLQYMIRQQGRLGRRVDLLEAMRQTTGLFII